MTERKILIGLITKVLQENEIVSVERIADHLLANGVMLVDTNTVNLVTNREPIQTAFGMPLDELADLIRAKQEGRIIVPPCKVGDKAAVRALCECVITTADYEECRNICPFEDDCECEDCDNCNERIFDTKVSAIYNNGNGWYIEFEHFIIQARFADIGTSFFVGETAHEQAVAYEKALAERRGNDCT